MFRRKARAVRRALDDHYRQYPDARPTLSEIALAMAEMDGNPLAGRPELIEQAARDMVAVSPDADGDDVLAYAAKLAQQT